MTHLPASRIKTIMKSTADVETVSKESLQILTRATVNFIQLFKLLFDHYVLFLGTFYQITR